MRSGFSSGLVLFLFFLFVLSGCRRSTEDQAVVPPATHPLVREYIGYGVVNISFTHLLDEPGPGGVSRAYLRRGTVVRVVERRQLANQESWVLAQALNAAGSGASAQGWLQETTLEIYDNESRANTASKAMNL